VLERHQQTLTDLRKLKKRMRYRDSKNNDVVIMSVTVRVIVNKIVTVIVIIIELRGLLYDRVEISPLDDSSLAR
jgi:hypothetical protein